MNRVACGQFEPDLSAYLDGELAAERTRAIERHLQTCVACRDDLAALRGIAESLGRLPRASLPVELQHRLTDLLARRADHGPPLIPFRGPQLWMRVARFSASAAVIVGGAFVGWRVLTQTTQVSNPVHVAVNEPRLARRAQEIDASRNEEKSKEVRLGVEMRGGDEPSPGFAARSGGADETGEQFEVRTYALRDTLAAAAPVKDYPVVFPPAGATPAPSAIAAQDVPGVPAKAAQDEFLNVAAFDSESAALPDIDIVVTPQSRAEYDGLAGIFGEDASATEPADDRKQRRGAPAAPAMWQRRLTVAQSPDAQPALQQVELQLGQSQVQSVIDQLEQQSPGRVELRVRWANRAQLEQVLQQAPATPTSERTAGLAFQTGRSVLADGDNESPATPADDGALKKAPQATPTSVAGARPGAPGAGGRAARAPALGEKELDKATRQSPRGMREAGSRPSSQATARASRDEGGRETTESALSADDTQSSQAAGPSSRPADAPVTLRINLLPPPPSTSAPSRTP